ncbi:ABC transporter permease [Streptomyces sp. P9(2023)]|uniref:FtsX-like permease family protein n=1 Tax=Streptomyces sp. P9(2023) TaxID=3064394 RepID=UPI0028F42FD0|nr:FtsX-like permease family protein [Streptomyces sp. P9(2023)]MDT9691836.1 ABC transporter permease [Streptomyces sp. P9(2023)]
MNPFLLGLRLLWRGGRRGRARFLLMTFGCSLGVACLAAVLTIPTILAAHDSRSAAREPRTNYELKDGSPTAATVALSLEDAYGSQPLRRLFVARPVSGPAPVPPGIDRLPAAGEVIVSPRLREVLAESPGVAGLLPGKVTGTIRPDGLAGPDDLYAYVGSTHDQIIPAENARQVDFFGSRYARSEVVEESTLDILRFTLACVVLLPLAVFLSVCARLSAESRARRLAALRLVGLSVKDTLRVNAGETVAAAFLGALLGVGGYLAFNEVMARIGLPGLHWYPADGRPEATTLFACLVLCPALAWIVGRHSARAAARTPLNVRRTAERKPPSMYGMLLLVPGLGVIAGYCALSVLGKDPSGGSANTLLIPAAVLLTGAGLVFGLPPLTMWLARKLAGTARSLPLALAMRRAEVEPGASLRVVTGLVLLIFATSLTQGVLVELDQVSRRTAPVQEYRVALDKLTGEQYARMSRVEGARAQAVELSSWTPADDSLTKPSVAGIIATCAQLAAFVAESRGCVDGKMLSLRDLGSSPNEDAVPGRTFPFILKNGRKLSLTVPHEHLTVRAYQPSAFSSTDVLIPPSLVRVDELPKNSALVLLSDADAPTVRTVLDGIGAIAPTAEVEPVGIVVESLAQLTVIRSLLAAGMVLGLVISVAAFVVSVADRAMERRGQVAALVLLGARGGTLRVVQCVQVVVPLAVGLGAAVVTGWLAESSYLITGGGAVHWDWSGLPLLLACCLGVLLAAAVSSVPLVRRHVDPEHIRRD